MKPVKDFFLLLSDPFHPVIHATSKRVQRFFLNVHVGWGEQNVYFVQA
jgi:hypothetical protein